MDYLADRERWRIFIMIERIHFDSVGKSIHFLCRGRKVILTDLCKKT
jgi:hypothetical protein